ncbi:kinase VIP2 domain containing protein [Pandoravirus japonicus]|uniref:Kinase VIP2 domain containing protein n=1 Tax=Pandoravirus japonicus TaxID=2823154 RepID=A0A811BN34_9VIRU|nr:kinase VIP2 domain containing protein [Pandoravirus japonicus]
MSADKPRACRSSRPQREKKENPRKRRQRRLCRCQAAIDKDSDRNNNNNKKIPRHGCARPLFFISDFFALRPAPVAPQEGEKEEPSAHQMANAEARRYAVYVARVLSDTVVKTLQNARGLVGTMVTGERAYNALVGVPYRTDAVEWEIEAWGAPDAVPRIAAAIARAVAETAARQSLRLDVIDDHFGVRLTDVALVEGAFARWDVVVQTTRWHFVLARVRRRAASPPDTVTFDDVTFAGPSAVLRALWTAARDPALYPRARARAARLVDAFGRASSRARLSGNLYKSLLLGGPAARARAVAIGVLSDEPGAARRAMAGRVAATAMGPVDRATLAAGVPVQHPRPRFSVSPVDVAAHDAYVRGLAPRLRRALLAYTGPASGPINLALLDRFFGSGSTRPDGDEEDPLMQAALVQEALLGAPPLTADARVYKVARFLYFGTATPQCNGGCPDGGGDGDGGGSRATTNYGLRAGDVERQWVFNSTTLDAWLDFGPFLDEFASCCAFVVRVPAGTTGALILGRNSAYPDEYEMLLPYGCAFAVRARRPGEVTYRGLAQREQIFYQDTTVYEVDYVPPLASSLQMVETDTAREAAAAMRDGANVATRVDLAAPLATPDHASAVAAHPHLAAFLAGLLKGHLAGGLALPGLGGAAR